MYKDLKRLFGSETPSVHRFEAKLSRLTKEERVFYYRAAYETAFCEWDKVGVRYRLFLRRLFQHDWQYALNFLREHTVLGTLQYPLQEREMLMKLISLLEGKKRGYMPSYNHLAFVLELVFPNPYKLSTFGDKLRFCNLDTDELLDLFARLKIHDIDEM